MSRERLADALAILTVAGSLCLGFSSTWQG